MSPAPKMALLSVGGTLLMAAQVDANAVFLTVAEVAERLKVNEETVRRIFLNEPGVVVICFPRRGRRVYRTLRIPENVFHRVLTRFTRLT
jgi:hypothetical protein